jgi:exopolysaccharide biosynthesis polyprenyl glycosylphosphotransferase
MLRERRTVLAGIHQSLDLLVTLAAFAAAGWIKSRLLPYGYHWVPPITTIHIPLLSIVVIWYPVLKLSGVYTSRRSRRLAALLWMYVKAISTAMMLLTIVIYFSGIGHVSRLLMMLFYLLNVTGLFAVQGVRHYLLQRYRLKGYNQRNVLIVGSGPRADEIMDAIQTQPWLGYRIIGILHDGHAQGPAAVGGRAPASGTYDELESFLFNRVVDEIIFASDLLTIPGAAKYIALADEMGVVIRILPQWNLLRQNIHPRIGSTRYADFLDLPTLTISSTPEFRGDIIIKTVFDYLVAALALAVTWPAWILAAVVIKRVSPEGPVFFRQQRVGQNGREFILYKFRTMVPDAEQQRAKLAALNEADGPVFKITRDPRLLPTIGALMRRTGFDELPQLINVFKGELSIVGPRPPLPDEVKCYQYWQRRRLSMKPGLTCFWQVQPNRNTISFEDWMRMDLDYIDNWSLLLDFKIMARTVWVMATGEGR